MSFDPAPDAAETDQTEHHVVEIAKLRPMLIRAALLLLETVVVPTLLLYLCANTVGDLWGLVAVLGWCVLTVGARMTLRRRLPVTLLLVVGGLVGRTTVALVFSNVYVYLFQPIVGSVLMAALFLGSAALGRPVTARLAQDFIALPAQLFRDQRVRRVFINVSLIFGVSRLLDAGMSIGSLHFGLDAGLLSRSVFSTLLTVLTIVVCAAWGWRRMRRVVGVTFRFS